MKLAKKRTLFFLAIAFCATFFFAVGISRAATITWTGGGADNNWSTTGNWSSGTVPGSSDDVIFNASSVKNCTINTNVSVQGLTIASGYTGTIIQSSGYTVTVGADGFSQADGTFTGSSGSDAITVNGAFSLTGGTFTSTAGTLAIVGTTTTLSTGFQANGGSVAMSAWGNASVAVTGSSTFNNLEMQSYNGGVNFIVATGTVLTVSSTFTMNGGGNWLALNGGGQADVQGDVVITNMDPNYCGPGSCGGNGTIVLDGAGTQNLIGATTSSQMESWTPAITITKTSGSVNLVGTIYIDAPWTNTNATPMSPGTSTVMFLGINYSNFPITGTSTFNNLAFAHWNEWVYYSIATGTTLTVSGTLTLNQMVGFNDGPGRVNVEGNNVNITGGGTINAQGNINIYSTSWASPSGSTITLALTGSGDQTILSDTTTTNLGGPTAIAFLPKNIQITKTSGSVSLGGSMALAGSWINTNATPMSPGTSTIVFNDVAQPSGSLASTTLLQGSSTFYNLILEGPVGWQSGYYTIATGTVFTANGELDIENNANDFGLFGGGEVDAMGNMKVGALSCYQGTAYCGGTATVGVKGTSTQLITGLPPGDSNGNAYLPNLLIAKPSGIAQAIGSFRVTQNLNVTSGQLQLSYATSATALDGTSITAANSSTIRIDGTTTVSAGAALTDYAQASSTIKLGSSVVNNGTVWFDGSGNACTLTVPNYIYLRSTASSQRAWSGSGPFVMRYVDVQYQNASAISGGISDWDGTDSGNNTSWSFSSGNPQPQLIQDAGNAISGTQFSSTLPILWPRAGDMILVAESARNLSLATPTDNASNTYTLVASSTWGSSPTYALGLYYAKNIVSTSSFVVSVNGTGSLGSPLLSGSVFEYTGIDPSSTLDTSSANLVDSGGGATALTSYTATGSSYDELYFGAMALDVATDTAATPGSGWTASLDWANNISTQALYTEAQTSNSILTTAATWTAPTSTNYAAILGVFHGPYTIAYPPSGTLDSATFDTGSPSSTLNSLEWTGSPLPSDSKVGFQFAVSNSASGPWVFDGPDGTTGSYFYPSGPGILLNIPFTASQYRSDGYSFFTGRYFRYRITLYADTTQTYTPTVTGVTVNWSP